VIVSYADFLRIKRNNFTDAELGRAITISDTKRALIDTNQFRGLSSGAISGVQSRLDIQGGNFSSLFGSEGAGIYGKQCELAVKWSAFWNCAAVAGGGGAIWVSGGPCSIAWVTFQRNHAVKGSSIFAEDSEIRIEVCQFSGTKNEELSGVSYSMVNVSFDFDVVYAWGPVSTRTFTPEQTSVILHFTVNTETPPPKDNTLLYAAIGGGVGGVIILSTVAAIVIVRARGSHNPQIYATEMTDRAPPTGVMYVTQSASRAVSKSRSRGRTQHSASPCLDC
jgi:hypothetical protein